MSPTPLTGSIPYAFPPRVRLALSRTDGGQDLYPEEEQALFEWVSTLEQAEALQALWRDLPAPWAAQVIARSARAPISRAIAERIVREHPDQVEALSRRTSLDAEAKDYLVNWGVDVMERSAGECASASINATCFEARIVLKNLGLPLGEEASHYAPRLLRHLRPLPDIYGDEDAPAAEQLSSWSADILGHWILSPEQNSDVCRRLAYWGPHIGAFLKSPRTPRLECTAALRRLQQNQRRMENGWGRTLLDAVEETLRQTFGARQRRLAHPEEYPAGSLPDPFATEAEDWNIVRLLLSLAPERGLRALQASDASFRQGLQREDLLPLLQSEEAETRLAAIRLLSGLAESRECRARPLPEEPQDVSPSPTPSHQQ